MPIKTLQPKIEPKCHIPFNPAYSYLRRNDIKRKTCFQYQYFLHRTSPDEVLRRVTIRFQDRRNGKAMLEHSDCP